MDLKMDSTQMNPEQQRMVMNMLRKQMQKEYELSFNKTESTYKEVEELDKGGGPGMNFMAMISGVEGIAYKNIQNRQSTRQSEFFGKVFLVRDSLEMLEWKLGKETKQIGSYTCYKATAQQTITSKVFTSEENEEGDHEMEEVDTIEVVAWYTPQIPISQGPGSFWGLPGLIMEVDNGNTVMLCSKVVLNPKQKLNLKEPSEGEEVTEEEFAEIMQNKIDEMQQIYGGGKRSGSGRMKIQISR